MNNILPIRMFSETILGLGLMSAGGLAAQNLSVSRPNIILILADDMGYSDLGCYGSEIQTPHLDELAKNGIRFTQFYNASRSCPTRASLLTGLYQHQAGVGDMDQDFGYPGYRGRLNHECVTLAEALKNCGYKTYMAGKWHVGSDSSNHPMRRGFDRYFGLINGASSYFQRIPYRINQKAPVFMSGFNDYNPPDSGFYFTDAIGDSAMAFLEMDKNIKDPFFLYLAFTAPHWPLHALPEDIRKYQQKYMKGWEETRKDRYKKMQDFGILDESVALSTPHEMVPNWDQLSLEEKEMWDLRMAVYAAMIDRLDQNIGRMLNKLENLGERENTMIIFLSDNGGCHEGTKNRGSYIHTTGKTGNPDSFDAYEYPWASVSNTPFRMFKHWVHEGGISTPCIINYPGKIGENQITSYPAHIIDMMPTVLDLAGGKYPMYYQTRLVTPNEGSSLIPVLEGRKKVRDQALCWEHEGNRAIRIGDWKAVSAYDYKEKKFLPWELYNLNNDRSEINDLARQDSQRLSEMVADYDRWAERVGVVSREVLDRKN